MCISANPSSSLLCRWEPGKGLTDNEDVAMKLGLGFTITANRPSKRRANVVVVDTIRISTRGDGDDAYFVPVTSPDRGETSARHPGNQPSLCAGLAT
jgi:hypothetical protein